MVPNVLVMGQVGNHLVLTEGNWVVDPMRPEERRQVDLPGTVPFIMTSTDDALWYADAFWPYIVKTDIDGNVLDWAEWPFERVQMGGGAVQIGVQGLAWDGENLWALDVVGRRACIIERTR